MSPSRHQQKQQKARLLAQIQQQRTELSHEYTTWLQLTTPYYLSSRILLHSFQYLLIGISVLTLYKTVVRHPRRLIDHSRRFITLWQIFKLLHSLLFYR